MKKKKKNALKNKCCIYRHVEKTSQRQNVNCLTLPYYHCAFQGGKGSFHFENFWIAFWGFYKCQKFLISLLHLVYLLDEGKGEGEGGGWHHPLWLEVKCAIKPGSLFFLFSLLLLRTISFPHTANYVTLKWCPRLWSQEIFRFFIFKLVNCQGTFFLFFYMFQMTNVFT